MSVVPVPQGRAEDPQANVAPNLTMHRTVNGRLRRLLTAGDCARWAAIQLHNTVNQKEKSLCVTKP